MRALDVPQHRRRTGTVRACVFIGNASCDACFARALDLRGARMANLCKGSETVLPKYL